jgi:hypothetical protein
MYERKKGLSAISHGNKFRNSCPVEVGPPPADSNSAGDWNQKTGLGQRLGTAKLIGRRKKRTFFAKNRLFLAVSRGIR